MDIQQAKLGSQSVALVISATCAGYCGRSYFRVKSTFNLISAILPWMFLLGNVLKLSYHLTGNEAAHYIGESSADIGIAIYGSLVIIRYRAFDKFAWCPRWFVYLVHATVWVELAIFLILYWVGFSTLYTTASDPALLILSGTVALLALVTDTVVFRLIYGIKRTVISKSVNAEGRDMIQKQAIISVMGIAGEMICFITAIVMVLTFDNPILATAMSDPWTICGGLCAFIYFNHVIIILKADATAPTTKGLSSPNKKSAKTSIMYSESALAQ